MSPYFALSFAVLEHNDNINRITNGYRPHVTTHRLALLHRERRLLLSTSATIPRSAWSTGLVDGIFMLLSTGNSVLLHEQHMKGTGSRRSHIRSVLKTDKLSV